ncbi:extensin-like [Neovison vison]|uniref:extensin-like n=1 Tax=Neovison vison TaxID=452646 RepID=UPI001CF061CA|nr:extensin-like [Neogale vison]
MEGYGREAPLAPTERAGRPRELVTRVSCLRTNGPVICVSHVTKLVSRPARSGDQEPADVCSFSRPGTGGARPAPRTGVSSREADAFPSLFSSSGSVAPAVPFPARSRPAPRARHALRFPSRRACLSLGGGRARRSERALGCGGVWCGCAQARSGRSSRPGFPPPPSAHPFSSSHSPAVRSRPPHYTPHSSQFSSTSLSPPFPAPGSSPFPHIPSFSASSRLCSALSCRPLARSLALHTPVFIFLLFSLSRLLCPLPPLSFLLPALLSSPVPLGFGLCIRAASKLSAPCFPLSLPFLPLSSPAVWAFLSRLPWLLPGRSSAWPSISDSVPSSLSLLLLPPASLSPPRSPFLTSLCLLSWGPPPTPACLLSHLSLPFPLSSFVFFPLHFLFIFPLCSPLLLISIPSLPTALLSPPPSNLSCSFLSLLFESVTSSLLPDFSPPLASFPLHLVSQCQGGPSRLCQPHPLPLPPLLPSPFLKFGADILPGICAAWNRAAKPGLPTPTPPPRVEGPL